MRINKKLASIELIAKKKLTSIELIAAIFLRKKLNNILYIDCI
jgi:hypothetical protein